MFIAPIATKLATLLIALAGVAMIFSPLRRTAIRLLLAGIVLAAASGFATNLFR